MKTTTPFLTALVLLVAIASGEAFAQPQAPVRVCREDIFAARRALPKLAYDCPEDLTDSDDQLLQLPQRRAAIERLVNELKTFREPRWWQASVDALNVCDFRGSAGALSGEEKQKLHSGEYLVQLFGNQQLRVVLISDPCYQTGYNGSLLLLLKRNRGQVVVSQLIDGYYSRVDNSVGIAFAHLDGQQIISVSTANSMPPSLRNYFFRIHAATGKASPLNLFRDGKNATNVVYSAMLFGKPADFGLPPMARELAVIRGGRPAPSFSSYEENEQGKIDDNGRKLRRIVYRWNGRFYEAVK